MNTKTVPFNIALAKRIQEGKEEGEITTQLGNHVRIICWDRVVIPPNDNVIVGLVDCKYGEEVLIYNREGIHDKTNEYDNLVIKVPVRGKYDISQMKPFDKVLVRDNDDCLWVPRLFSSSENGYCRDMNGCLSTQCIPYEGNENLCFTTDTPCSTDFRVGQRVQIIHLGVYGTITELTDYNAIVKVDGEDDGPGHDCSFMMLEPVNEKLQKSEFKPFEKVLVKNTNTYWGPALFSHKCNIGYAMVGGEVFDYCVRYEGNENLVGTTKNA